MSAADAPGATKRAARAPRATKQPDTAQQPADRPKLAISADGRRVYTLFVPGIPRNNNGSVGHWAARWQDGQYFKRQTAVLAGTVREGLPPLFARVTCTLVKPRGKLFDVDNAYTCCKNIIDGLKGIWILDDSPAHIELVVNQERGPVRGVRVVVEEVA